MVLRDKSERQLKLAQEILNILKKSKNSLTETELQIIRNGMKDVPEFNGLPSEFRDEIHKYCCLIHATEGTILIDNDQNQVDGYVMLHGECLLESAGRIIIIDTPFSCFGDFSSIGGNYWRYDIAKATKNSYMMYFTHEKLCERGFLLTEMETNKKIIDFLNGSIPNFKKYSSSAQYKMLKYFTQKTYKINQVIYREGDYANKAYLIQNGDCSIMINHIPARHTTKSGDPNVVSALFKVQGFISKTINEYNIGMLTNTQWFGEDDILLGKTQYSYTVIAKSTITVFEIKKQELFEFPKDIQTKLIELSLKKKQWIEERSLKIDHLYPKVFALHLNEEQKLEEKIEKNEEEYSSIKQRYPGATQKTLRIIHKSKDGKLKNEQKTYTCISPQNELTHFLFKDKMSNPDISPEIFAAKSNFFEKTLKLSPTNTQTYKENLLDQAKNLWANTVQNTPVGTPVNRSLSPGSSEENSKAFDIMNFPLRKIFNSSIKKKSKKNFAIRAPTRVNPKLGVNNHFISSSLGTLSEKSVKKLNRLNSIVIERQGKQLDNISLFDIMIKKHWKDYLENSKDPSQSESKIRLGISSYIPKKSQNKINQQQYQHQFYPVLLIMSGLTKLSQQKIFISFKLARV